MIIRVKHNPTILALESLTWKELHKMVKSHTDQYTKRLSCMKLHDHTHQAVTQPSWRWSCQHGKNYTRWLHHTPINTRKDYHASTFMIIRIKQNPTILALESINMERTTQDGYITHRSKHEKEYHASNFMIIRVKHNPTILALELSTWKELHKMVTSHTQYTKKLSCINFMIIRIKLNPTILSLELSTWKELHKMVTSHTDQNTKRLSCINLHDHTHQA